LLFWALLGRTDVDPNGLAPEHDFKTGEPDHREGGWGVRVPADPEALRITGEAYDAGMHRLGNPGRDFPISDREAIAQRIIETARQADIRQVNSPLFLVSSATFQRPRLP
jgi:hypothetical protein